MADPRYVLVGVDGSPESDAAVDWASREALSRNAQLRIVSACDSRYLGLWTLNRTFREELRSYGKPLAAQAAERAALVLPHTAIETAVLVAPPGRALGLLSSGCELIVVGRTGRGALSRLVFGSTTREVLARSSCPVVAVNVPTEHRSPVRGGDEEAPRVVVAVRDAATNAHSLRFAFAFAQLHQAELQIVQATRSFDDTPSPLIDDVSGWQAGYPTVESKIVEALGDPATFIAEICQSGDLLVVGHHRHAAWTMRPLGAHLLSVLHAAPCSVAVVPEFSTPSQGQ